MIFTMMMHDDYITVYTRKNLHSDIPQQGPIEKDDISTIGSGVFRCIYASSQSPPVPFVDSATCVPWFGVSDWVGGGGGGCGDF